MSEKAWSQMLAEKQALDAFICVTDFKYNEISLSRTIANVAKIMVF